MGISNRLQQNFDTNRFGDAKILAPAAANTLNLIANTSGHLPNWQQQDLGEGPPVRTNYFKNPTSDYTSNMLSSADVIFNTATLLEDTQTSSSANQLKIEINAFRSHTDNISGVVEVSNTFFPSLQSAQNLGQLNMMTLSKSNEGVSDTTPLLGAFSSLFVNDLLEQHTNELNVYAQEYASSVYTITNTYYSNDEYQTPYTVTSYASNMSGSSMSGMTDSMSSTKILLNSRRTGDVTFYTNSLQLAQDVGYMQQFNSMGGTMTYLVKNVVGTDRLLTNLFGQN